MSTPLRLELGSCPTILAGIVLVSLVMTPPASGQWSVVERSILQDQGHWQVDYRLRHHGTTGLVITPSELSATVEAWVSNSRVPGHATPKRSAVTTSGGVASAELLTSSEECKRCRERVVLSVWDDAVSDTPATPSWTSKSSSESMVQPVLSVAPGGVLNVRVRLEHQHVIYGDYDPLLGRRQVDLKLGTESIRDVLMLDREQYLAQARGSWPEPPLDRRDPRFFIKGPDSLHLEAHIPGNGYYRFTERPVRYGTRMRLRYWYLIAPGTEGECRARIAQYKETPTTWKVLSDGCHEEILTTVGRWVHVETYFRTESEATTLALDFRVSGADIGEMWIDDINLEPVGDLVAGP